MSFKQTASLTVLAAAMALGAGVAEATVKRPPTNYPGGYVTAESRFGNGEVSGPVRRAANGWQVRLPGGTWEYCRRSCSETLRVETVDKWEGPLAGSGSITQECGIFGCLELRYPRY